MAPTSKSLTALKNSKEAVSIIKEKLIPVLQRLSDDSFGEETGRAQASVALSLGMMRYMAARVRGLDQGRRSDDPLRKDLNNMKRVLAKITKQPKRKRTPTTTTTITTTTTTTRLIKTVVPCFRSNNHVIQLFLVLQVVPSVNHHHQQ